ncbi:hypothetical protein G6L37_05030 [Agrobacterium rubi]|nr:hypothetical protein [Agrobacterium rubi]NTF24719.1 hypothetical protein [Agrobacterium rubi]
MALFDVLPSDLFKPLASPTRVFYAEMLLSLHMKTFALASDAPRRTDVIGEITAFLLRWERLNGNVDDTQDEGGPLTSPEDRSRSVYQRLCDTGWLIEHKDGYIRRVDLDPDAGNLLHVLAGIERGETRTYGGAVVGVLSMLQSAGLNPAEFSENVKNALRGAHDFMQHMRTVSVSLRKIEERIVRQDSLREIFRHFFEDFVQKHLISDFKTLHTKDNPFRFRAKIIHQAQTMSSNSLTTFSLGEGYAREGRASTPAAGEQMVLGDLADIIRIFESTEGHLAAIDNTAARIEKRILTTARYMDRAGGQSESRIIEAMKAVSSAKAGTEGISVKTPLLHRSLPIGPAHIPTPRREKAAISQTTVREAKADPAFEAYREHKADYVRKTRVSFETMIGYLDRVMKDRVQVRGRDIAPACLEDFVPFQRLREIPTMFDGAVARKYEITILEDRMANDWIECQDFVIKRRGRKNAA